MTGPFEEFLGGEGSDSEAFQVSYEHPSRVWFQKADRETISIPYTRITLIRYDGQDIILSLGEHAIRIEGQRLMTLYEALHEERVTEVREQGQNSLAEFGVAQSDRDSEKESAPVINQILWDSSLCVEG